MPLAQIYTLLDTSLFSKVAEIHELRPFHASVVVRALELANLDILNINTTNSLIS